MTRRKSGRQSSPQCGPSWPKRASRRKTLPASASPISGKPPSSGTAKAASRFTMRSCGRTVALPSFASCCDAPVMNRKLSPRRDFCSIPIFPRSKIAWLLDHVEGARAAAEDGRLAFGTIDCFLLWRLTGGKVYLTDATNASRTLLFDIGKSEWDDDLCRLFSVPHRLLPEVRDCAGDIRRNDARLVRRADPYSRHRRRPAGRYGRAGLFQARHDEVDLRHRLFRASQYRSRTCRFTQSPAHHHCLSARRPADLCTGRGDLCRRRRGAMAARRVKVHRRGIRCWPPWRSGPIPPSRFIWCRPLWDLGAPYWDAEARGAIFGLSRNSGAAEIARAALEAVAYQTRDLLEAMHADWPSAKDSATVLRVDGGMTASDVTMQYVADILASPVDRPRRDGNDCAGGCLSRGARRRHLPRPRRLCRAMAARSALRTAHGF